MAKDVFIPKLGQTMEEGTLVRWLVDDGTKVDQGQEILEVETDKAVFAVEATGRGTLHIGPYQGRRCGARADRGGRHRQARREVCGRRGQAD